MIAASRRRTSKPSGLLRAVRDMIKDRNWRLANSSASHDATPEIAKAFPIPHAAKLLVFAIVELFARTLNVGLL